MHSMLVAPGDRGGEGQGALKIWKIEDKDELVFSAGGRLFHRTGAAVLNDRTP